MEHPGLSVTQIKKEMTLEQVQQKISELSSRQAFAYGMGKTEMIDQLNMMMAVYQRAQKEMLDEMFNKKGQPGGGLIDIS